MNSSQRDAAMKTVDAFVADPSKDTYASVVAASGMELPSSIVNVLMRYLVASSLKDELSPYDNLDSLREQVTSTMSMFFEAVVVASDDIDILDITIAPESNQDLVRTLQVGTWAYLMLRETQYADALSSQVTAIRAELAMRIGADAIAIGDTLFNLMALAIGREVSEQVRYAAMAASQDIVDDMEN